MCDVQKISTGLISSHVLQLNLMHPCKVIMEILHRVY